MDVYHSLPLLGSTHLGWLAVSPLHFKHLCANPPAPTKSQALGTAVHRAVLEPELFAREFCDEPSIAGIDAIRPRATSAYGARLQELVGQGKTVLRDGGFALVDGMARAVRSHPIASKALARAGRRELSIVWEQSGRLCRARADALGPDLLVDVKTTRTLRGFSPFELSRYAYHRQMSWYRKGLRSIAADVAHVFLLVVESSPPHDVGVFTLGPDELAIGEMDCDRLVAQLDECESTDRWPGMFPDVQPARLTDALVAEGMEEVANGTAG